MSTSLEPTRYDDETSKRETFRQHLRSCTRRSSCEDTVWHGFDISDNPEMYMEERRKHSQAKLTRYLKKVNGKRLSTGYNPLNAYACGAGKKKASMKNSVCKGEEQCGEEEKYVSQKKPGSKGGSGRKGGGAAKKNTVVTEKFTMAKKNAVIKLSDVRFSDSMVGRAERSFVGTLEAHVNGFQFSSKPSTENLNVVILFNDIKASFFRLGYPPNFSFLHFHLQEFGKRKTFQRDYIFRLLSISDSGEKDRNNNLEDFIYAVENRWMSTEEFSDLAPIQEIDMDDSFVVEFMGSPAFLALTLSSILVSSSTWGIRVIDQEDMEIVNFVRSGCGAIHMTVICQDFRVDSLLQVTIPLQSFSEIKSWLDRGNVKYYVNEVENWESRLKEIAGDFQAFLERGGWDQFQLEDKDTIQDYYSMSESDYSSDEMWGESCSESDGEEEE